MCDVRGRKGGTHLSAEGSEESIKTTEPAAAATTSCILSTAHHHSRRLLIEKHCSPRGVLLTLFEETMSSLCIFILDGRGAISKWWSGF